MTKQVNVTIALIFIVFDALTLAASAQAPPPNLDLSSIWSSKARELDTYGESTARALGESSPVRLVKPEIRESERWASQDVLICKPK
jgi:hypothetical protein